MEEDEQPDGAGDQPPGEKGSPEWLARESRIHFLQDKRDALNQRRTDLRAEVKRKNNQEAIIFKLIIALSVFTVVSAAAVAVFIYIGIAYSKGWGAGGGASSGGLSLVCGTVIRSLRKSQDRIERRCRDLEELDERYRTTEDRMNAILLTDNSALQAQLMTSLASEGISALPSNEATPGPTQPETKSRRSIEARLKESKLFRWLFRRHSDTD